MTNDQELLRDFIETESEAAFQGLVRRHLDLVYGVAMRQLGEAGWAEEVAQNVFVALARKARYLGCEVTLAAWLHRTTLLETRQRLRSELRRRRREETALAMGKINQDDESLLQSLAPMLDEGLAELGEKHRQVLLLRFFEGKNLRAVAESLHIQEDAAQKRVARALDVLTDWFRKRGYTVSSGAVAAALLKSNSLTSAAPVGLVAAIAQAALQQGVVGPMSLASLLLAKVCGLTKLQTASACLLLSAGPLAYEWNASLRAREALREAQAGYHLAEQTLEDLRRETESHARRRVQAERLVQETEREIAYRQAIAALHGPGDPNLYRWTEGSDYVRLPKSILEEVTIGEMSENATIGGYRFKEQDLIAQDGTPSFGVLEALGLSEVQQQQTADFLRKFFQDFEAQARARSYFVESLPREVVDQLTFNSTNYVRARIRPGLAPDAVRNLREVFDNGLAAIMGKERAQAFCRMDEDIFERRCDEFGALTCLEAIRLKPGAPNMEKHQEFVLLRFHFYHGKDDGTKHHLREIPGASFDDPNLLNEFLAGPPVKH